MKKKKWEGQDYDLQLGLKKSAARVEREDDTTKNDFPFIHMNINSLQY